MAGMISRKVGAGNGDTVTVRCCTVRMLSHVCLRRNFFLQMSRTKSLAVLISMGEKRSRMYWPTLKTIEQSAGTTWRYGELLTCQSVASEQLTINRVQEYANTEDMSFYDALRVAGTIPGVGKSVAKTGWFRADDSDDAEQAAVLFRRGADRGCAGTDRISQGADGQKGRRKHWIAWPISMSCSTRQLPMQSMRTIRHLAVFWKR